MITIIKAQITQKMRIRKKLFVCFSAEKHTNSSFMNNWG